MKQACNLHFTTRVPASRFVVHTYNSEYNPVHLSGHVCKMEEAVELKNQGNAAFKNKDWATAVECYTKAIEKNDKEPSFYTNRAQVRESGARPGTVG